MEAHRKSERRIGMNTGRIVHHVGDATLGIGAALGLFAVVRIFLSYKDLPVGSCPFDADRPVLYVALGFVFVSLVLSFFEKPKKKGA
jgi:hypothetical protein